MFNTDAIHNRKPGKADGVETAASDILINGCDDLFVHISFLFKAMLVHGTCPSKMLISTPVPIPKDKKKSLNDSNNYRSIALGSLVGKVLDKVILDKHVYVVRSDDLQFGFKNKAILLNSVPLY